MFSKLTSVTAAAAVGISATVAQAQAVQWRFQDGGNGHWYALSEPGANWHAVAAQAVAAGGHLATLTSEAETIFAATVAGSEDVAYIGAMQDAGADEPLGGWRWITGEPWGYETWHFNMDDAPCAVSAGPGEQQFLWMHNAVRQWDDVNDVDFPECALAEKRGIIEWSADCNNDGLVDYGQILDGTLADANADGVLDVCVPANGSFEVLSILPDPDVVTDAAVRVSIAATGYPWKIRDRRTGVSFLLLPPGTFTMGSDQSDGEAVADEMPAHAVTLTKPFYLGQTEVTQAQWRAMTGTEPSYFGNRPNNPVERVSWNGTTAVASVLGYRLPTEAEWEYACRGGKTASRYGPLNEIAWWGNGFGGTSGWGTNPVGTKAANAFGFHDMIGNVWEPCQDRWGGYGSEPQVDPEGPQKGGDRVARSGDWYWPALGNRATYRGRIAPDDVGLASLGVRFAITPSATGLYDPSSVADCNSDNIADVLQCRDGSLPDYDSDGVPDCCEAGIECVVGSYPVQWHVAVGGNGHWYVAQRWDAPMTWEQARNAANGRGGHLACPTSAEENAWIGATLRLSQPGCQPGQEGWHLGGYQDLSAPDYAEPAAGWRWVTGEPWVFTAWLTGVPGGDRPNNFGPGGEHHLKMSELPFAPRWDDVGPGSGQNLMCGAIIEWSADCDSDGVVDLGQVLRGEAPDLNANRVPDTCECLGDLYVDGFVNGADLGALLAYWGPVTGTPASEAADINRDGTVNGSDLGILLASWGTCEG